MTKTKMNMLLATTAVFALSGCLSVDTPSVDRALDMIERESRTPADTTPPVEGEEYVNAGGLTLTAVKAYENGALLSALEEENFVGTVYISDAGLAKKFPSSTEGEVLTEGRGGKVFFVSTDSADVKSEGGRYVLVIPNEEGTAAAQLTFINDRTAIQNSAFGTTVKQMPSGTVTYSNANDIGYARIRGEGIPTEPVGQFMDFELVVNFDEASAALSTSNSDYQMTAKNIAVNTTTGTMFSNDASIGLSTDPMEANMSGYIVGTNGGAVTGIVNSTDAAIPTLHGQFVGLKQP